jgi:hypothetical protein
MFHAGHLARRGESVRRWRTVPPAVPWSASVVMQIQCCRRDLGAGRAQGDLLSVCHPDAWID